MTTPDQDPNVYRPDQTITRQEDTPYDSVETLGLKLFQELCGQYGFLTEPWREKSLKLMDSLTAYLADNDEVVDEMLAIYRSARDDARLRRGEAEFDNFIRDARLAREQAEA